MQNKRFTSLFSFVLKNGEKRSRRSLSDPYNRDFHITFFIVNKDLNCFVQSMNGFLFSYLDITSHLFPMDFVELVNARACVCFLMSQVSYSKIIFRFYLTHKYMTFLKKKIVNEFLFIFSFNCSFICAYTYWKL